MPMIERFNAVSPALKGNVPLNMLTRSINYQIWYPGIIRKLAEFCKKIVNSGHLIYPLDRLYNGLTTPFSCMFVRPGSIPAILEGYSGVFNDHI